MMSRSFNLFVLYRRMRRITSYSVGLLVGLAALIFLSWPFAGTQRSAEDFSPPQTSLLFTLPTLLVTAIWIGIRSCWTVHLESWTGYKGQQNHLKRMITCYDRCSSNFSTQIGLYRLSVSALLWMQKDSLGRASRLMTWIGFLNSLSQTRRRRARKACFGAAVCSIVSRDKS